MKACLLFLFAFRVAASLAAQTAEPPPAVSGDGKSAPSTGLTDDETAKVLAEITKVQQEFARTKKEVLAGALEKFRKGAGTEQDALDLYLASYRVVNIDRKPATSKEDQEARANGDWQKKALSSLGEGTTSAMLQLQVELLVVLLESANATSDAKIVARLRSYMQAVIAYLPAAASAVQGPPPRRVVATVGKKSKREEEERAAERTLARKKSSAARQLRQPVTSTLFAEAYSLGTYIEAPAQWPRSPADFRAAYSNIILPWYRANKKSELPAVWDEYLKAETMLQEIALQPDDLLQWGAGEYKTLYWSKWLDLLTNGITATTATQELVKTIRENPNHPALKTWVADLAKVAGDLGGLKFDTTPPPRVEPNP
ncbi:MAG: hypothetical protein K1X78_03580 [Verrucomicrobiaceae bacterium]|nr:hypothetical protein [Verrucomicrobiaceae bacterium]